MTLDATFWVAISFIIFLGVLIYLKIPQLINKNLNQKISAMQKELDEAEKLREESKNLLNEYENKLNESTIEVKNTINLAKKESEKNILETTEKFYKSIESKKLVMNEKIQQMKNDALKEVKNESIKIAIETTERLLKNSIDKAKLNNLYKESLESAKATLKKTTV